MSKCKTDGLFIYEGEVAIGMGHNEEAALRIAAALNSVERVNAQAGVVEALEFYADPLRYHGPNQSRQDGDRHTPVEFPDMIDVTRDGGDIARAALAAVKEKDRG